MNSISDIISDKAEELFQTPVENTQTDDAEEEILDLESEDEEIEDITEDSVAPKAPSETLAKETVTDEQEETVNKNYNLDLAKLKKIIHSMKDQLDTMLRYINSEPQKIPTSSDYTANSDNKELEDIILETGERIIEGIFDGEKVIGPDGKEYSIPPNYASKSKLVEGDTMKLTITANGRFIYKQISQIKRKRLAGELVSNDDQWSVLANGKTYKVLTASVTFYKGTPGDEVIFFCADDGSSSWGAVENIIKKKV